MTVYRAFPISAEGHVSGPGWILEVASDDEAVEQARRYIDGHDIEVWHGSRLLIKLLRYAPRG